MSTLTHLEQFKLEQELKEMYDKRRGEGYFEDVVYVRRGSTRTKPDIFTKRESYSFLQYIRVIFHWAKKNTGLPRPHIELLLYLQPLGIFKKKDFSFFCRLVQVYQIKLFTKLVEQGWIEEWRPTKKHKGQAALYKLTSKADHLCTRIHKMCIGEEKIPESKSNALATSDKPIDRYYMNVIKQMNKARD
jgi:predicted transcriptional regulator